MATHVSHISSLFVPSLVFSNQDPLDHDRCLVPLGYGELHVGMCQTVRENSAANLCC
jgi:hypothetical protein